MSVKRCKPSTGPTPGQWLLLELQTLPGCEDTKARVFELLRRFAGQRLRLTRRDLVQPDRERAASAMLAAGLTATEARRRLAGLYEVSQDTAERIMSKALSERWG